MNSNHLYWCNVFICLHDRTIYIEIYITLLYYIYMNNIICQFIVHHHYKRYRLARWKNPPWGKHTPRSPLQHCCLPNVIWSELIAGRNLFQRNIHWMALHWWEGAEVIHYRFNSTRMGPGGLLSLQMEVVGLISRSVGDVRPSGLNSGSLSFG